MMNPYMMNPYQTSSSLIRVSGIDGAKAYQMAPNSVAPLFDASEDLMYIKSTDGAGFPTIRTFQFEEVQNNIQQNGDFVSRSEFEKFKEEVMNLGKQLIPTSGQTANNPKGEKHSTANDSRKES